MAVSIFELNSNVSTLSFYPGTKSLVIQGPKQESIKKFLISEITSHQQQTSGNISSKQEEEDEIASPPLHKSTLPETSLHGSTASYAQPSDNFGQNPYIKSREGQSLNDYKSSNKKSRK